MKLKTFTNKLFFCGIFYIFAFSVDVCIGEDVKIFYAKESIRSSERGYAVSAARTIEAFLAEGGVACDFYPDTDITNSLINASLAFWVMPETPTDAQLESVKKFITTGGKLSVFYSSSSSLAKLMKVTPGKYKRFSAESKITGFNPSQSDLLEPIKQSSPNIFSASPVPFASRVIAEWCDDTNNPIGEAAILESDYGWWFTHILFSGSSEREKICLLLNMVSKSWGDNQYTLKKIYLRNLQKRKINDMRHAIKSKPGEIRAVWDQTGQGLWRNDWKQTFNELEKAGITDIFINVAGPGFAHYASAILPKSRQFKEYGDQLAAAIDAAKKKNIRVHAWLFCFCGERSSAIAKQDFVKKGWVMNAPGETGLWLNPESKDLQELLLKTVSEICTNYAIDGVHLDFVRYPDSAKVKARPDVIGKFVYEVKRNVSSLKPNASLTAAVFGKYPTCIASVGQDWESWISTEVIDFAVAMAYTQKAENFREWTKQYKRTAGQAARVIAGIGVTSSRNRLSVKEVTEQIKILREFNLAGFCLFDLDGYLAEIILPALNKIN